MSREPTTYAVTVQGHLDDHWAGWLGGLTVTHHDDGTTTLVAPVADQAGLHGLLARLRDLGVTLVALRPVSPTPLDQEPRP